MMRCNYDDWELTFFMISPVTTAAFGLFIAKTGEKLIAIIHSDMFVIGQEFLD